jgi:hypothetical protein
VFAGCKISPEEFTDEQKEYFTTDVWCGYEWYSLATFLLYSDVCSLADDGIEQGYGLCKECWGGRYSKDFRASFIF